MNPIEMQNYLAAGLTTADIANLMLAERMTQQTQAQPQAPIIQPQQAQPQAPIIQPQQAQPQAPIIQPQQAQPQQAQPQAPIIQPQQAQPQPVNDFTAQLAAIGAALQQNSQPAPPVTAAVNQPSLTPANAGITTEEATKLFQAWSMGSATQQVELPPSANDVLAKRFNSLYGVDTSKSNTTNS